MLRLIVSAQHDDDADEVEQRRRQEQEPTHRRERARGDDNVGEVGKEVGEADSSLDREPGGLLLPAPESDGLGESEGGPLPGGAAQESDIEAYGKGVVEKAKPEVGGDPGNYEEQRVLDQRDPEVDKDQNAQSAFNHAEMVSQIHGC